MADIIFQDGKALFVGGAAAASSNCCCGCCCTPGDEETGPHWDFGKTKAECALAGGTWTDCPPGGCACPPCVPTVMLGGFDPVCPGVGGFRVLLVGNRNAALFPFGFPVGGFGPIDKVRVSAVGYFTFDCTTNTLELTVSVEATYRHHEGLSVGDCYVTLVGSDISKQWFFRWQGNPQNAPCFGGSAPPLVFSDVQLFAAPGAYDRLQQENADAWQIFEDGPTVSVSCGATEYACEQP